MKWFIALCILVSVTHANFASYMDWEVMETDHYKLYYYSGHHDIAIEALNELELNRALVKRVTGSEPNKFSIVLEDAGQLPNGMVTVFPERMSLWMNQPAPYSFSKNNQYSMRMLTTHELTHMAHLTTVRGGNKRSQAYFGNLFAVNIYSPRWWTEGLAVYTESQNSVYEGRLNDGYTHAYFHALGRQKTVKTIQDISFSGYGYVGGNTPYLYGGRFVEYLSKTYGENSLQTFIADYGKNEFAIASIIAPTFGFDASAKRIYGKPFKALISDWQDKEIQISSTYNVVGDPITQSGWNKSFLKSYKNALYFSETMYRHPYPLIYRNQTTLKRFNTSKQNIETLYISDRDITTPFCIVGDNVYFTHSQVKTGFENNSLEGFGAVQELYKLNIKTKNKRLILTDTISAFLVNEKGDITYVTHPSGSYHSELKTVCYSKIKSMATLPIIVSEIDSVDGDFYCVGKRKGNPWTIYKINGKTFEVTNILTSPFSVYAMACQKDGIVFTSDHNSERQTYKFDFKTEAVLKLSSGSDGAKGVVVGDDLFVTTVSEKGEDILKQKIVIAPALNFQINSEPYSFSHFLKPKPDSDAILKSSKGLLHPFVKLGVITMGADDMGLLKYDVTYSTFTGFGVTAYSTHFRPFTLGIQSLQTRQAVFVSVPIYRSLSPGIRQITGLADLTAENDIYLGSILKYGFTNSSGQIMGYINPGKNRYFVNGTTLTTLKNFTAKIQASSVKNDLMNDVLRGFKADYLSNGTGFNTSVDGLYRISMPRMGCWAFPVSLEEDAFLGAFYDYSERSDRSAFGYYVSRATQWTIYGLGVVTSVGQSFSNGESTPFVTLEAGYSF